MNRYAITDDTGRIEQIYSTTGRFIPVSDDVDDTTHYIDTSTWTAMPKRKMEPEVELSALAATIRGIPAGVLVKANGVFGTTDGEPLRIEFDLPGNYTIELSGAIEYLDTELEVTVDDSP